MNKIIFEKFEPRNRTVCIRLTPEEVGLLKKIAKENKTKYTKVIGIVIKNYLKDLPK